MRPSNRTFSAPHPVEVGMCFMWNGNPGTIPVGFAPMDGNIYNGFQTTDLKFYTPVQTDDAALTLLPAQVSSDSLSLGEGNSEHTHGITGSIIANGKGDAYEAHSHDASNVKKRFDIDVNNRLLKLYNSSTTNPVTAQGTSKNEITMGGTLGNSGHDHVAKVTHSFLEGEHAHDSISYGNNSTSDLYRFRARRFYTNWIVWVGYE